MAPTEQTDTPLEGLSALKNLDLGNAAPEGVDAASDDQETAQPSTLPEVRVKKIDDLGRAYSTGKRKSAIARVWIKPGKGTVTVNGHLAKDYFANAVREMVIAQPFVATNTAGTFDVVCTVKGGGLSGQAGAVRHGISRALQAYDPDLRPMMKPLGLLTRDARRVERKKFGRAKARRSFQFSKR